MNLSTAVILSTNGWNDSELDSGCISMEYSMSSYFLLTPSPELFQQVIGLIWKKD